MWRLLVLSCAALSSLAAQEYFFPLEVGNVWIYRGGGTRVVAPLILEIPDAREFDGNLYYRLHGEPAGDFWLRFREDGSLIQRDEQSGADKVWYSFNAPVGEVFATAVPFCCGKAMLAKDPARYEGPTGFFWANAKEFTFPGVFQIGLTRAQFAPYIGMIYRAQNTGGPSFAAYDLTYARIGGVTMLSDHAINFTAAADPFLVRLSLSTNKPVTLRFASGQTYDVSVRDAKGNEVYRWSDGKVFAQALRSELIDIARTWIVPLPNLPPGGYTAQAWLTLMDQPEKAWSATTTFTIPEIP